MNDLEQAVHYFEQYFALLEGAGRWIASCAMHPSLGDIYRALGDYHRAIEAYDRQIALCQEFADTLNEIRFLNSLRNMYAHIDDYDQAVGCNEQVTRLIRQLNDHDPIHDNTDNYQIAIAHFNLHLNVARDQGDRIAEGNALANLGLTYYAMGDYPSAIESYDMCIQIFQEVSDRVGMAFNSWNMGLVHQQQGDLRRAIERMHVYIDFLEEVGHPEMACYKAHLNEVRQQYRIQPDRA